MSMMSNNQQNGNLDELSIAYARGKQDAEAWVAQFTQNNQQPLIPRWANEPTTQGEYYYRRAYMERFKEITKIDVEQEKKLAKKNQTLSLQRNGKVRPNSIDREIKKHGHDFLSKYGDRYFNEIKRLSENILRDLANGNINVPDYEEYFRSDRILTSLISVATANFNYHRFIAGTINFYGSIAHQSQQGLLPENYGPTEQRFYSYHYANAQIYETLLKALIEFKQFLDAGIFNPESIHTAEVNIYNKKLNVTARDPYVQRRLK